MIIKQIKQGSNWVEGQYDVFTFQAKIFPQKSDYGIPGARRISKLWVLDAKLNVVVLNYDRGWDTGKDLKKQFKPLFKALEAYAQTPKFADQFPVEVE